MNDSDELPPLADDYCVWASDKSQTTIDPECAPVIDRAMKLWAESRRDSWVSVHGPSGGEYSLLASTIVSTSFTTRESRRLGTMRDKQGEDERAENRRLAGYIESE